MDHTILFSADVIAQEVRRIARAIDAVDVESYVVVAVLKGAAIFSSDLVRRMGTDTELAYITASSYVQGFAPGDSLIVTENGPLPVRDRHVLIVEDIVDTGRTLQTIQSHIELAQPRSVSTVALVDKTVRRTRGFDATYTGFKITDEFIYGYGLDWDQRYRDLPYIAIANP